MSYWHINPYKPTLIKHIEFIPVDLFDPLLPTIWVPLGVGKPVELDPSWAVGIDIVVAVDHTAVMLASLSNLHLLVGMELSFEWVEDHNTKSF